MSHATDMADDLWDDMADPGTSPGEHRSPCVHRPGSRHPGADCGTCDRGDCDDTPEALRERAAEADQRAADSWERSDTDGFLSQWAHGITADRDREQAALLERGGLVRALALFTTDGEWVPARRIETRFGQRWMVRMPYANSEPVFLTVHPKRRDTLAKKGYVEGYVMRPGEAQIVGSGTGLSGAANARVALVPTDRDTDRPPVILTTDRWAVTTATCRHCERTVQLEDGRWVDPEATGDDSVWRETCDQHDTFTAEHEPTEEVQA